MHPGRHHDHLAGLPAGEERLEKIGDCGTRRARHHRDPFRKRWQRPLSRRRESTLRLELRVKPPQLRFQRPGADGVEAVDRELVGAAGRVDLEPPVADDLEPIGRLEGECLHGAPPDHRPQHRRVVLERQVDMAARGPGKIADLARHPDV